MRIRKHAKTSAFLLHTNSTLSSNNNNIQPSTLCLLNQSPWDIITFPSSHSPSSTSIHLFDDFVTRYDVNVAPNPSSACDSTRPIQSIGSTKNSFDCDYDIADKNFNGSRNDDENIMNYESYMKAEEEDEDEEDEKLGFFSGDNCVDKQNDVVWSSSKKAQSVTKSRGNKKRAVAVTSKQNEFYYYSGFGPSWGKKRGNKCTSFDACGTTLVSGDIVVDDMDVEEDEKRGVTGTTMMRTVWSCREGPGAEYFDDVEKDEEKKTVKKRGRKPIKERSLKSLM